MSGKPSKAALARLRATIIDEQGQQADPGLIDLRADSLRELAPNTQDEQSLALIQEVFAHTELPKDKIKVEYVAEFRASVRVEWQRAGQSFLRIGRLLLAAEQRLTKYEYDSLIEGAGRLLPFGRTVAIQLRRVAQAVDAKRLPEQRCPSAYSVAYVLATLPDEQLRLADERNLIRPDVRREEVRAFKAEVIAAERLRHGYSSLRELRKELEMLRDRKRRHILEAVAIRRRMQEVQQKLRQA
ncbi:hypothetical protein [Belnapia moabensis]|jgi:hypothetical protein|uniref:hypothetical protein n=1 Tax=Belnapia moabensis TaxID=365533 RepID=UPI0005B95A2A|nr:hypothetical protein [Belnapia moabensis]